jgi:hypothetical protein
MATAADVLIDTIHDWGEGVTSACPETGSGNTFGQISGSGPVRQDRELV